MKIRFTHSILTVLFLSICCFLPRAGEAQAGSITGTVVDDNGGAAVANVRVAVYAADDDTVIIAQNRTDAAGGYSVTGLDNGDYKVWFLTDETDYIKEWYNDSPDFSGAQTVSLISEIPVNLGETRLILGGKITGTVTYNGTSPSADVYVQAYDSDRWAATALVDKSTGEYALRGLPAGSSYTVFFWAYYTDYVSEWYNNMLAQTDATFVSVTADGTTSNIDAELALGAEITGTVRDSDGNPIEGALALVYDGNDSEMLRGFSSTGGTGLYTVTGLPGGGSFKVQFCELQEADGSCGGFTEWYNDKGNFDSADTVSLGTGATGIDAVLESRFNWFIFTPVLTHRPAAP